MPCEKDYSSYACEQSPDPLKPTTVRGRSKLYGRDQTYRVKRTMLKALRAEMNKMCGEMPAIVLFYVELLVGAFFIIGVGYTYTLPNPW